MTATPALARSLLPSLRETTRAAGRMANDFFRHGSKTSARTWSKHGGSPVTEADIAVDEFLKERLSRLLPEAGWLSEETADDPARLAKPLVWVVDPIDGTRAFSSGHPDWSISIALLSDQRPVIGLLFAPAHAAFYEAILGEGATRDGAPIAPSTAVRLVGARVAGPKPLVDRLDAEAGPVTRLDRIPSLALRLARVAEGAVDVALVSTNSHDWDLAAADLILHEAGARLSTFTGAPPLYNRAEPVHGELLAASRRLHPDLIEAMTGRRPASPHP